MIAVIGARRAFSPGRINLARIKPGAECRVFQQIMRRSDCLEPRFGPGIIGMQIRVLGANQLAVILLDIGRRGGFSQTKGCIRIVDHLVPKMEYKVRLQQF